MIEFRRRLRLSLLVAAVVGSAVVTMVVDRRALLGGARELPGWSGPILDVAVPIQKMVTLPVDALRSIWSDYLNLVGVEAENEELRRRLARLQEDNLQLREALVASGRLEHIAEMRQAYEMPMLPSELVGVDASPWFRSALIDRGRSSQVEAGMPVISERGLVGLVTATSGQAAKTMLLLDRQSAVEGIVQRSRTRGIVRGNGSDALQYEFVARESDVRVGDLVITSGLGGVYPKGLRVGEVVEVRASGTRLLKQAVLEPAVDFGRLEQVFVMLRRGPTMELLYGPEDSEEDSAVASRADP